MNFGKNIKRFREREGLTQKELAEKLGYKSSATIGKWETNDNEPPIKAVKMMAELFDIPMQKLVDKDASSISCLIPILGKVVAGVPLGAIEDVIGYEEISEKQSMTGTFFALKVKGDSMSPRLLEDDVVICKKQEDIDSGDIAIFLINGDEATIKKIRKTPTGIYLLPLNSTYEPMFFSNEEIESLPVKTIGKVIEQRRRY